MSDRVALLSIVVPVFNSYPDLQRLIESLLPQRQDHQLIVVDDGSTDDRVSTFLATLDGVTVVSLQRRRGSSGARNAGIRVAQGERVLFIDADCVAPPNWIAEHERFHSRFADAACIGAILPLRVDSLLLRFLDHGPSPIFGFGHLDLAELDPMSFRYFYTANGSVPRQALLDAGLFDERYNGAWDDIELAYRLEQGGLRFLFSAAAPVRHRNPERLGHFLSRQVRVGRGYWRAHRHHPEMLDRLTLRNQWQVLVDGIGAGLRGARRHQDQPGFVALEVMGRLWFWSGYLAERRARRW